MVNTDKNLRIRSFLAVISVFAGVILAFQLIARQGEVPESALQKAKEGVGFNDEWQAITRRIGGVQMVLVPAGCFAMGSTDEQLREAVDSCDKYYGAFGCQQDFSNEQPSHDVCLRKPFWIDRTAVSNLQFWLTTLQKPGSPYGNLSLPVQGIAWQEAADYCQRRGGRLPSEAEWEFAARGPDALTYPFGNEYAIDLVTLRKVSPPRGGEIPQGGSWVGALDLSGGQSEWTADWYGPYPTEAQIDPSGPETGTLRVARGGNWFAHAAYFVRSAFREPLAPDYTTAVVGLRCVVDLSP